MAVDLRHAVPRSSTDRVGNQARWRYLHTPEGRFVDGDGRDAVTCRSHAAFHEELAIAFRGVLVKYELADIPLGRVTGPSHIRRLRVSAAIEDELAEHDRAVADDLDRRAAEERAYKEARRER